MNKQSRATPRARHLRSAWHVRAVCGLGLAGLLAALIVVGAASANGSGPSVDWWVIGGGGAPSSGGSVTLNDTLGQPIIGSSAGGTVSLNAGYWVSCVAAAAVVPVASVARSGADVIVSWAADPANAQYQVWVSTNPYLDPANPGGETPVVTASTAYTDTGAATSLANHFYIVRGLNACAIASASSGRRGEFTFGLTPGTP